MRIEKYIANWKILQAWHLVVSGIFFSLHSIPEAITVIITVTTTHCLTSSIACCSLSLSAYLNPSLLFSFQISRVIFPLKGNISSRAIRKYFKTNFVVIYYKFPNTCLSFKDSYISTLRSNRVLEWTYTETQQ
jgi:hypothetical protein